jgi:hypothetical protein
MKRSNPVQFSILCMMLTLYLGSWAQSDCGSYDILLREGYERFQEGDFRRALSKYQAAMVDCPEKTVRVQPRILEVFNEIERLLDEAEIAKVASEKETNTTKTLLQLVKEQKAISDELRIMAEENARDAELFWLLAEAQVAKCEKLINAFYFYDQKFALACGLVNGVLRYYYINREGEMIDRFKVWNTATPFGQHGFAIVDNGNGENILDTSGVEYRLAKTAKELTGSKNALYITDGEMKRFSSTIFLNPQIRVLVLPNCGIRSVPGSIGRLRNLKVFDVGSNGIKVIPKQIGEITGMQRLNLKENVIEELPPAIGNLISLIDINLSGNKLEMLPEELGHLTSLRILGLHRNGLKVLPSTIGNLKKLESLDLSENLLATLPASFSELSSLKSLSIRANHFEVLPQEILQLKNLEKLSIAFNPCTNTQPKCDAILEVMADHLPNCEVNFE